MATDGDQPCGILARCLGGIVGFVARRPRLALWCMVFIGCAAVGITTIDLQFRTSRSELLNPNAAWDDYAQEFGGGSDIVVVVKSDIPNAPMIEQALSRLAERLEREPEYFSNVLCRLDQRELRRKALQLQTPRRLKNAQWLADYAEYGEKSGNWNHLQLDQWTQFLTEQVRAGNEQNNPSSNAIAYADRLTSSLYQFVENQTSQSPWPEYSSPQLEASAQDRDVAFLMSRQGDTGFLRVHPVVTSTPTPDTKTATTQTPTERLRYHVAEVQEVFRKEAPDLTISLTGIAVLESDELSSSEHDMYLAAVIAFLAVGLLLSLGLRGMRHPMLVMITIVNALAITFGIVTVTIGHLNILSICFVAITVGLGVDFSIHFVTRYLYLRQELYELEESLVLTGRSVGMGIFTSAATTAIAFGSAVLTGYPGLAELGIITALGVMVCAGLTFTFLPALIALSDAPVEVDELPVPVDGKMWRSSVAGFPLTAIALSVLGIAAVAYNAINFGGESLSLQVSYDSNLLRLQDSGLNSVRAEADLARAQESLLYAVAIAKSREEADTLRSQFASLPTVDRVVDVAGKVPGPPTAEKSELIQKVSLAAARLQNVKPAVTTPRLESVGQSLKSLQQSLVESSDIKAKRVAVQLQQVIKAFASKPNEQRGLVDSYQSWFVSSLMDEFGQISNATSLEPIKPQDLPVAWRNRYVRADGERELWLMKIYPKDDVWNEAALASFVGELRTVAPDVTGVPVRNFDSSAKVRECYQMIGLYSLAAIGLFLLFDFLRPGQKLLTLIPPMLVVGFVGYTSLQRGGELNPYLLVGVYLAMVGFIATVFDFRNLRDTLIALIPPIGGGLMLLGLMALLHVDFNPINLIVLPLVLGIGVDDGVHLVHDYRRQLAAGATEYTPSGDTVNGVLLTSLTSIVGFGSLMVSAHQGLKSVGVVLALGVACCMAVALILVPALLVLVARHQPASLEPIPIRLRAPKADSPDGSDGDGNDDRQMSRREKRRQAA